MNQKSLIAVLGVVVVILIGTTVYFATINKVSQSIAPVPKVVQQPTPAPVPVVQPTPEISKSAFDKTELQNTVFSAVNNEMKVRYEKRKDPGYLKWGNKVDITSVESSLKAAKGKWYDTSNGDWGWIAFQQDDGNWKILLSFDGFNCKELESVPSQYNDFFREMIYPIYSSDKGIVNSKNKYCY